MHGAGKGEGGQHIRKQRQRVKWCQKWAFLTIQFYLRQPLFFCSYLLFSAVLGLLSLAWRIWQQRAGMEELGPEGQKRGILHSGLQVACLQMPKGGVLGQEVMPTGARVHQQCAWGCRALRCIENPLGWSKWVSWSHKSVYWQWWWKPRSPLLEKVFTNKA